MIKTSLFLGGFALIGSVLVALTFDNTYNRIAANEREFLLRSLQSLVPPGYYDNDIAADTITVVSKELLGTDKPVSVYRARKEGAPVAAILAPNAPDGYNGSIKLLVAIRYSGTLYGVRVVSHRETPGLGDGIEIERSDWIRGFEQRSLSNPASPAWLVKRDGGAFDQLTGATITPRAVVKAVHNSLIYYQLHRDQLFVDAAPETTSADG